MDLLTEIIENKKIEVALSKQHKPESILLAEVTEAQTRRPSRDFYGALLGSDQAVIAECKSKSPSKGVFIVDYDPVTLARTYQLGGASAVSVLTDQKYFGGHLDHLKAVAAQITIPVLRKDFIVDPYQIYEARAAGADSFLLIAGVLKRRELESLIELGRSLGMECLVESHTQADLKEALATSARIIGVNNRSLKNFSVDLKVAQLAAAEITRAAHSGGFRRIGVCESGIHSRKDVEVMKAFGYSAFLVGEALVTSQYPAALTRELCGL